MCGRKTDLLLRVDDLHGQRLCIKLRIGNLKPHGRGVSEPLPRLRVGDASTRRWRGAVVGHP